MVTSDLSTVFYRGYLAYLRQQGWHVTIVANDEGRLLSLSAAEGVDVVALRMVRDPAPVKDFASLWRMKLAIRRIRPDVLVYSTPKGALLASLAGLLNRVPVRIYSIWGLRHETARGIRRRVLIAFEKLTAACSTDVAAVSPSLASELRSLGIARDAHVIGAGSTAGVDTSRFDRSAEDIAPLDDATGRFLRRFEGKFTIAFIGRINRDKGVGDLIQALRLLHERGVVVPAIFVGPEEDPDLSRTLRAVSAHVPIHIVGLVKDTRPYLNSVGAICLPSWREGFGQVIAEAAAMSVPAVATDATGVRDVVVPDVTGIRVPVGDPAALAEAIARLAADPVQVAALGRRARERTMKLYSSEKVWAGYEQHFRASLVGR